MYLRNSLIPLSLAFGGVLSDYITTVIALKFCVNAYEINSQYNPLWAFVIFFSAILLLKSSLPEKGPWRHSIYFMVLFTYFGALNNILVILGIFPGF